ncbi:MAG: hypothetical protein GY942_05655, partial [Aestuariibacter sp.]|nr:hypothetical protein [Aestuariibacter sp.]
MTNSQTTQTEKPQPQAAIPVVAEVPTAPHSIGEKRHDEQYIAESFRSGEYPYKR